VKLRGGTVRDYLRALRDAANVPGATEYTLRPPLVDLLTQAAVEHGSTHSVRQDQGAN
jgi:hypothetical protein